MSVWIFWNLCGRYAVDQIHRIRVTENILEDRRDSIVVLIAKENQQCLLQRYLVDVHIIQVWGRVIDRRLKQETSVDDEYFGFEPGRGTEWCHI